MKCKVTVTSITITMLTVSAFLATSVMSWQDPECMNVAGSTTDQMKPCCACVRDAQSGDWYYQSLHWGNACNATVWNAAVTLDTYCGYWGYPAWIITQTGPGLVTANATPTPLVNATCVEGCCTGTLGTSGAVTNKQVWGASPCRTSPPS